MACCKNCGAEVTMEAQMVEHKGETSKVWHKIGADGKAHRCPVPKDGFEPQKATARARAG